MKKLFSLFIGLTVLWGSSAQTVSKRLQDAYRKFENDSQLSHAISSLYIINAQTGAVVFDKNSKIGLAPASTLKLLTAATAYELLGKNFRYKTELAYDGKIENGILKGNIYFTGNGDPTLGSWRWKETSDTALFNKWYQALLQNKIHRLEGALVADDRSFETQSISDGWIWQDIGNYYGAGCWALNWKENQYDIRLKSGNRIGDPVEVVSMDLKGTGIVMRNELRSAASGSGDNAYVYLPPYSHIGYLRGTIPVNENNFLISGSVPDAPGFLLADFYKKMEKKNPEFLAGILLVASREKNLPETKRTTISTHYSPPLDSMVYWFLRRSINLYGEAFSKTLAYQKKWFW